MHCTCNICRVVKKSARALPMRASRQEAGVMRWRNHWFSISEVSSQGPQWAFLSCTPAATRSPSLQQPTPCNHYSSSSIPSTTLHSVEGIWYINMKLRPHTISSLMVQSELIYSIFSFMVQPEIIKAQIRPCLEYGSHL